MLPPSWLSILVLSSRPDDIAQHGAFTPCSQQSQCVEYDGEGDAHVGGDGGPEVGVAENGEQHEDFVERP